jgi:pimeloyl-ACP methyl ester carboxylesterase
MAALAQQTIDLAGRKVRVLRGGARGAPSAIFLHGGIPGITPFCSGAHMWGDLQPFLAERDVIVPDLPGSGGTALGADKVTLESFGRTVIALLDHLTIAACDVVGHDVSGLLGLWLAMEVPARLRSLSVVASQWAPPRGDGLDNVLLVSPPPPLWGRESQVWALERLSYSHAHIDATLLDACVAAGEGEAHRGAVTTMREQNGKVFVPSMGATRGRLWEVCRGEGLKVPTQVVWGSHDPTVSREAGFVLFDAIAHKQPATHFHVVNRAGTFPFREEPNVFHHMVASFQAGVLAEGKRLGAKQFARA